MTGCFKTRMLDLQKLPPLSTPECIRIITNDEALHDVPERNLDRAFEIDPELRTIPGRDFNRLLLTREDRFFLWDLGVSDWGEPNG